MPGGAALVVDREMFSALVDERIRSHPNITVETGEAAGLPGPGVVATGPLTSEALAEAIAVELGTGSLAFYDAIAPIVSAREPRPEVLYALSRWGKGDGDDYLNAADDRRGVQAFLEALGGGRSVHRPRVRQGALFRRVPAGRGDGAPGARDPPVRADEAGRAAATRGPARIPTPWSSFAGRTGPGQMWNLVGFQTRLRIPEQQRVFRMIPGLAEAEFLRYGSIHRNTYINSPAALAGGPGLAVRRRPARCSSPAS